MKQCSSCGINKDISKFYKNSKKKDGLRYDCKTCCNNSERKYRKTLKGLCLLLYKSQKSSSKTRGHNPPDYTFKEFVEWLNINDKLNKLYNKWVESGYHKNLKPSVNRIKDNEGYSFNNIELVTWIENKQDQYNKSSKGFIGNELRPIYKLDLNGNILKEYISINEAVKETGLAQGNIWKVINGIGKTLGGYKWKYKNNK